MLAKAFVKKITMELKPAQGEPAQPNYIPPSRGVTADYALLLNDNTLSGAGGTTVVFSTEARTLMERLWAVIERDLNTHFFGTDGDGYVAVRETVPALVPLGKDD